MDLLDKSDWLDVEYCADILTLEFLEAMRQQIIAPACGQTAALRAHKYMQLKEK